MTPEQLRLKEIQRVCEKERTNLETDNLSEKSNELVLHDLLLQTIAERDEARVKAVAYRDRAVFAMYANQIYQHDFDDKLREPLPWEPNAADN